MARLPIPEITPQPTPSRAARTLQAGDRVTRYPLGSGPELQGTILGENDPRVWTGTSLATHTQARQSEATRTMATFGELPVFYPAGVGLRWENATLLYKIR